MRFVDVRDEGWLFFISWNSKTQWAKRALLVNQPQTGSFQLSILSVLRVRLVHLSMMTPTCLSVFFIYQAWSLLDLDGFEIKLFSAWIKHPIQHRLNLCDSLIWKLGYPLFSTQQSAGENGGWIAGCSAQYFSSSCCFKSMVSHMRRALAGLAAGECIWWSQLVFSVGIHWNMTAVIRAHATTLTTDMQCSSSQ